MDIKPLLQKMLELKASDLHIRAKDHIYMRVDGKLHPADERIFTPEETLAFAKSLMNDEQEKTFHAKHEVDLAYTFGDLGRFRVNVYSQLGMVNMVMRVVPTLIPTIQSLKLPEVISKVSENQRGLVIVTGTTGCGKSTTLASMINHINETREAHIVTVEDPIEYIHTEKKAIISQRELGFDTLSYPDALRNVLRQDPNVILLGEMRDLETMGAAITAAQTGHLVLSTVHTVDAVQSVNRILDMFPPHQQQQIRYLLADTLRAVISQRLLPHSSGHGRVPAVEVLINTPLVKKLIEENNLSEITNLMKQGQYYGMQTFNQALIKLFQSGEVKLEDALAAAANPEELMLSIRGIQSSSDDANSIFDR